MGAAARLVRRFGWLPLAQLLSLVVSTAVFAVLARVLGPTPFATYAVVIFCFTLASLLTDLSPMGFVLVHGLTRVNLAVARTVAAISSGGGVVVLVVLLVVFSTFTRVSVSLGTGVLMVAAVLLQNFAQPPRARLVVAARYRLLAAVDVGSTVVGGAAALWLGFAGVGETTLVAQFAVTVFVRLVVLLLLQGRAAVDDEGVAAAGDLGRAIRYGGTVIPVNVAAYLSRALDSGLLPTILPAALAASYARSYQVVVVPVMQAQLALGSTAVERLAHYRREGTVSAAWSRLFVVAVLGAGGVGAVAILAAPLIDAVLFGPGWVGVVPTVAGMASCIPSLVVLTLVSWALQIAPRLKDTILHLLVVVLAPISVLVAAALTGSLTVAVSTLVVAGGLVQPVLSVIINRRHVPVRTTRAAAVVVGVWVILAGMYVVLVGLSS